DLVRAPVPLHLIVSPNQVESHPAPPVREIPREPARRNPEADHPCFVVLRQQEPFGSPFDMPLEGIVPEAEGCGRLGGRIADGADDHASQKSDDAECPKLENHPALQEVRVVIEVGPHDARIGKAVALEAPATGHEGAAADGRARMGVRQNGFRSIPEPAGVVRQVVRVRVKIAPQCRGPFELALELVPRPSPTDTPSSLHSDTAMKVGVSGFASISESSTSQVSAKISPMTPSPTACASRSMKSVHVFVCMASAAVRNPI